MGPLLLPGPEGRGLDPVLARRGTEPAGAVPGHVHVGPVAARRRADTEPPVHLAAEHDGKAGGAASCPALRDRVGSAVEVQMPGLAVVPVQLRPGAGLGEHRVDQAGRRVDLPGFDRLEDRAQPPGGAGQRGRVRRRSRAGGRLSGAQRRSHGVAQPLAVWRLITPPAGFAWRERVHETDRHRDDRVDMTGEIHLTSYILIARL